MVDLEDGKDKALPNPEVAKTLASDQKEDRSDAKEERLQLIPHDVGGKSWKIAPLEYTRAVQPSIYSSLDARQMRGMFPAGKIYTFMARSTLAVFSNTTPFQRYWTISSSPATGIVDSAGNSAALPEWSTFAALFDEYRVPSMNATWVVTAVADGDTGISAGLAALCGNSYSNETTGALSTTTSTRFNAIRQFAEAKLHPHPQGPSTTATAITIPFQTGHKWRFPTTGIPQAWDSTVSPATAPYGSIEYCANNNAAASRAYATVMVTYTLQFRNRT